MKKYARKLGSGLAVALALLAGAFPFVFPARGFDRVGGKADDAGALVMRLDAEEDAAHALAGDTLHIVTRLKAAGDGLFPGGRLLLRWGEGRGGGRADCLVSRLLPGDSLRIEARLVVPFVERADTLWAEVHVHGDSMAAASDSLPIGRTVPGDAALCPPEAGEVEGLSAAGRYLLRVSEGRVKLFDVEGGIELSAWTLPGEEACMGDEVFALASGGTIFLADVATEEFRFISDPAFHSYHPAVGESALVWIRDRCGIPGEIVAHRLDSGERITIPLAEAPAATPSVGGDRAAWRSQVEGHVKVWAASIDDRSPVLVVASDGPLAGPAACEGGVLYAVFRGDSLWEIRLWNVDTGKSRLVGETTGPIHDVAARGFLCAWSEGAPGEEDVWACDVRGGRRIPVSLGPGAQVMPALSDSTVYWVDRRAGKDQVAGLRLRIPSRWRAGFGDAEARVGLVWESVETVGTLVRLSWTFRNVNEEYMVRIYRVPIGLSDVSPDDEVASGRVAGPGRVFFEDRTVPAVGKREWVNYFVGMEGAAGALLFGPYPTLLPERPAYASLRPAGPNPTREGPRFSLSLPAEAMGEPVTLYIYDCGGRLVRRSTEGESRMGSRLLVWDRKNGAGMPVGPGVYFFQVRVGDRFAETRKVVLLSP